MVHGFHDPSSILALLTNFPGGDCLTDVDTQGGIEKIRAIARENGKKGGRPPKEPKEA